GELVTEINPATGAAVKSFHTGFSLDLSIGGIAVQPGTGTLLVAESGRRLLELDPETGRNLGNYDPIANSQFGTVQLFEQGVDFPGSTNDAVSGLAYDNGGQLLATTYGGRVLALALPGAPTAIQVSGAMAVALDGTPEDPLRPSANAGQRIRLIGS